MTTESQTINEVMDAHVLEDVSHGAVSESAHEAEGSHELVHEATLYAEPVAHIGSFPITNALLTSWVAVFIIIILALSLRFSLKKIPGKFQAFFEMLIDGALDLGDQVTGDRKVTKKVFPIAISVFFFILINNWLGILPLMSLGVVEHGTTFVPFLRSGTADVNTTVALATISVVGANLFGVFSIGIWKMFNKYINLEVLVSVPKKILKDPIIIMVAPITFAVGLIEIVGEFAKIASLSLRLFGNVFAGEVLLMSMGALVAYAVPIPFLFLEVFVGVIQAFIFAVLTMVYFTIAAQDHDHDEHDHAHDDEHGAHVLDEVPGEVKPA